MVGLIGKFSMKTMKILLIFGVPLLTTKPKRYCHTIINLFEIYRRVLLHTVDRDIFAGKIFRL